MRVIITFFQILATQVNAWRNMAWTFSNLLRHKPYNMSEEEWTICYKVLVHYLKSADDDTKSTATN